MKYIQYLILSVMVVTTIQATNRGEQQQRKALSILEKKSSQHALHLVAMGLHFGLELPRQKITSIAHSDIAAMIASVAQKQSQKTQTQHFNKQIKKSRVMRQEFKRH